MTDRCADCQYFNLGNTGHGSAARTNPQNSGYPYRGWGACQRITDGYEPNETSDGPEDGRLAIAWDYEGYSAGVYVSGDFGCVMFEAKDG